MKTKRAVKLLSVLIALSMVICCMSFAFANVTAVTVSEDTSVSSTAAGSIVEDDGFTWDNATVYFLLTDRFRNGDTSNDHSYDRATDQNGDPISGWDTSPATFHGGDFAGITDAIEEGYFEDLGVNALWISAPYEQIHGYCDSGSGFAHYSYHGYYVLDYTETDANFGTAEEFETLVDTAHEHGLRVIIDIVMNHAGYNTVKDMEEFNFGTLLSGASEFKYKLDNVSDVNNYIDFTSSSSDWGRWWGSSWIRSGLPGYSEGSGDDYTRSLEGLPDFRTEQTTSVTIPTLLQTKWKQEGTYSEKLARYGSSNTVTGYLTTWLSEWVSTYGVDGFRCDTAKHVEQASWKQLKTACVEALKEWRQNNPDKAGADWEEDFWMTGECWDHSVGSGYDAYFTQGGFDSMINFDTCGAGILSSSNVANVYQSYADAINSTEGFNALSFISSHDELLTRGDTSTMIYNGSALLLTPGGVQIFYGDETNRQLVSGLSFDGYGGSGHSLRSDMNWDSIDETILAHWQKVGQFRNNHVSVGAGQNTKLTATNGVAFGRTYDKNGVYDQIAAVIGASSNTSVTIDVSSLWSDGQQLMNAYDQSSATVTNGKVTFNSGANGTILIQEPDGKPLMSILGDAKFKGTQTVTVSLEECDSAVCSIDGGNKFVVTNGSTFEIGSTAYEGDTITITLEATNEKGSSKSTVTFYKMYDDEEETSTGDTEATEPVGNATLYIQSDSAPYVYAWTGSNTELCGAWPGTKVTTQNSEGYYVMELDTTGTYNVVLNDGNGNQSGDLTNLSGDTYLKIPSGNYGNASIISTGSGGGGSDEPYEGSITVTIKPYSSSASYYIYTWTDSKAELAGAWPGTKLTEKDSDGNYVYTVDGYEKINVIINMGSGQGQTSDITGVTDGAVIEITNEGCTSYKLTEAEVILSSFQQLKKEAREVLAMTSSDYTAASWSSVAAVMTTANSLIAQGESSADETLVASTLEALQTAKAALVIAPPVLSYAVTGKTTVCGVAVQDANITLTVNGKTYTTTSDEITGEFSVEATALTSSSVIRIDVERNGLSSATYSYNMSNGNITEYVPTTTEPTTSSILIGDVTQDGKITVDDATLIQKYIAELAELSSEQITAADVDNDIDINIKDVTEIQKYLAGMSSALD